MPTIYNFLLLHVLRAGQKCKCQGSKAPLQGKQPSCKAQQVGSGSVPYKSRSLLPHSHRVGREISVCLRSTQHTRIPYNLTALPICPKLTPSSNTTSVAQLRVFPGTNLQTRICILHLKRRKKKIAQKKFPQNILLGNRDPLPGFISSETGVLKSTLRNILCFYSHKTVNTFNACHAK